MFGFEYPNVGTKQCYAPLRMKSFGGVHATNKFPLIGQARSGVSVKSFFFGKLLTIIAVG